MGVGMHSFRGVCSSRALHACKWKFTPSQMATDSIPYADTSNESVILKVATGVLPAKLASLPYAVPEEVRCMMECCWGQATERPTAQECQDMLIQIMSSPIMDDISGECLPYLSQGKWYH